MQYKQPLYYDKDNAWGGQEEQQGLNDASTKATTAFSGVFEYVQSSSWIQELIKQSNSEVRQAFETCGYGAVGWTCTLISRNFFKSSDSQIEIRRYRKARFTIIRIG